VSLPATAVATAVAAAVAHLLMRLAGRRYTGPAPATRRLRRDLFVGSLLSVAGTIVALLLAGGTIHPAVSRVVAGPEVLVSILTMYGYTLAGSVVVLAGYLGFLPAIRRVRGLDLGYGRAALSVGRWLAVAGVVFALVTGGTLSVSLTPVTTAVGIVALTVGVYAGAPLLVRLSQPVRTPTPDEQRLLDRLCARAGADAHRLRVLERRDEVAAAALVRGPPGYRYLYVSDYLLDALDEDAAAAILALAVANARHTTYRVGVAGVVGGLLLGLLTAGRPLAALAVPVGSLPVAYLVGRRLVFRADARAADRLGDETVADALDRQADLHDASLDAGLFARLGSLRPSVGQRIDRLRTAAE
jgi:STE24 endopeptidase